MEILLFDNIGRLWMVGGGQISSTSMDVINVWSQKGRSVERQNDWQNRMMVLRMSN